MPVSSNVRHHNMNLLPIPPNSELQCGSCGKLRTLTAGLIEQIATNSFPNRLSAELYESDLKRFKCTACNERNMRKKPAGTHLPVKLPVSTNKSINIVKESDREYEIVARYLNQTSIEEQKALLAWARGLQEIKNSNLESLEKAKKAIMLTVNSGTIQPFLGYLGAEIKRVGWDERGLPERMALSAAAVGALLFSGQGAGIAALGGAIGVPLWVVFGAGGAFIGVLINEVQRRISDEEDEGKGRK